MVRSIVLATWLPMSKVILHRPSLVPSATEGGWRLCIHQSLSASRMSQKVVDGFGWKFVGRCVTRTNRLDFGEDLDLDTRIFKVILHHWEILPKMIYSTISQTFMDGLGRTLVDTFGAWQGRIYSILVTIWIYSGYDNFSIYIYIYIAWYIKKVVDELCPNSVD